jgi:type I restriction enzyme M protein
MTNKRPQQSNTNGELNFVDSLWKTANKLRGSVESAEYKHIVLGLIFLKYISDAFIQRHDYLEQATKSPENLDSSLDGLHSKKAKEVVNSTRLAV